MLNESDRLTVPGVPDNTIVKFLLLFMGFTSAMVAEFFVIRFLSALQ